MPEDFPARPDAGEVAGVGTTVGAQLNPYIGEISPDPRRVSAYRQIGRDDAYILQLYRDTLRDEQAYATLQQRLDAAIAVPWEVQPGGELRRDKQAADDLRGQLRALDFDSISRQMLFGIWFGFAVAEAIWAPEGSRVRLADLRVRAPDRFRWERDREMLLRTWSTPFGEPVPPAKFWVLVRPGEHGDVPHGRKALSQIAAIKKLGARTRDFADLVPKAVGVPAADRAAILEALRTRARLLDTEIAPRIRASLRAGDELPPYEAAFVKEMGRSYATIRRQAVTRAGGTPRHGMTDPELTSAYAYTTSGVRWGYGPLNKALRSADRQRIAAVENYRQTLNAALARLPDHVGVVNRGTTLPEAALAKYWPGATVTEEAFTSASTGSRFRGPHRFVIHSRHGKWIEPYSAHGHEKEVLFAAGTRFKVLEVEPAERGSNYVATIHLKEVE